MCWFIHVYKLFVEFFDLCMRVQIHMLLTKYVLMTWIVYVEILQITLFCVASGGPVQHGELFASWPEKREQVYHVFYYLRQNLYKSSQLRFSLLQTSLLLEFFLIPAVLLGSSQWLWKACGKRSFFYEKLLIDDNNSLFPIKGLV